MGTATATARSGGERRLTRVRVHTHVHISSHGGAGGGGWWWVAVSSPGPGGKSCCGGDVFSCWPGTLCLTAAYIFLLFDLSLFIYYFIYSLPMTSFTPVVQVKLDPICKQNVLVSTKKRPIHKGFHFHLAAYCAFIFPIFPQMLSRNILNITQWNNGQLLQDSAVHPTS